jgi:rhamnose transport system substrate-binding protein
MLEHLRRSLARVMRGQPPRLRNGERFVLLALVLETVVFSVLAPRFFTATNFVEVLRLSVELGLLAIALTPVIICGGIDLSVGAVLGLSAVIFGTAYHDWNLPVAAATLIALAVGAGAGLLNGLLIAKLALPPLIVTLASLSLFRGVAEGMTHAAVNFTDFPNEFLFLGQGYLWGIVPAQLPILIAAACGCFVLLHRSIVGRALYTIGLTAAGARYAGIPVSRRVLPVYTLSGFVASVAALIYVAHLGQARSDAGTGYELDAVTAVVLGGTSIYGGRGTLVGTLIGLFALSVLKNGLQLAALPTELTGVLTGGLLIGTIALDRFQRQRRARVPITQTEDVAVKNTQVAVLCGAILVGALMTSATNVWLVRSLQQPDAAAAHSARTPAGKRLVIAMMPKAKGDPYFVSCLVGAEEAARELDVELLWDGPTGLDAARQNEMVENWITRGVDVIAAAVENKSALSTVLRKARARGIKVLTWDADAEPDARDYFVNQATAEGIAGTLTDEAARLLGETGEFAIITGALSAANQNEWIANIKKRLAEKYPSLTLATIRPSDDDRDKAFAETQTLMRVFPQVRLVMAISAPAVPGAAEAVRQAGRTDIKVIGLSLPNINKPYVHGGVVQTVILWNTRDLGYLTVYASAQVAQGTVSSGMTSLRAGRIGSVEVRGNEIVLGEPIRFTKANIDRFDF